MPESWLNIAILTARKIGNRYRRENNFSAACFLSTSMDDTISWSSCSKFFSPIICNTVLASATRPFSTNQRGLRGIRNNITKNNAAGMAVTLNYKHHRYYQKPQQ